MTLALYTRGRRGHDRMVVGFTTTCTISAYHHWCCEFESCSWRGVFDTTLWDKVCQCLGWWFFLGSPVSSNNKTLPRHNLNIVESGIKHHNPYLVSC